MKPVCWVVTDSSAGMENQAWGLAQALGYEVVLKHVFLKKFWEIFSPYSRFGLSKCLKETSSSLEPPFPDLLIASGRRAILPSLWVKKRAKESMKLLYLQDPKISPKHFDFVVCPKHDGLSGDNVLNMIGCPHRLNHEKLNEAKETFYDLFAPLSFPRRGVLLGGPNKLYSFDLDVAKKILTSMEKTLQTEGGSFMITCSRRTPPEVKNYLKENLYLKKDVYFWDETTPNPYFGLLAWSDVLLLTCESVSMLSEAVFLDRPVYLLKLPGKSGKFEQFHTSLLELKRIRWFEGEYTPFSVTPLDLTQEIAKRLHERGL